MTEKNGDLKYKTDNAIDEAYRRGYEDKAKEIRDGEYTFYEKGLNDAWECAKKAWSMSETDFHKIFNTEWDFEYMLDNLSATEVVQKIKDYEERQTRYDIEKVYDPIEGAERYTFVPKKKPQTEEIEVGDEVKVYDDCIGIVTRHAPQARTCYVMYRDGSCGEEELTDCKKTGNHSMSLDKWLEQMRKESE